MNVRLQLQLRTKTPVASRPWRKEQQQKLFSGFPSFPIKDISELITVLNDVHGCGRYYKPIWPSIFQLFGTLDWSLRLKNEVAGNSYSRMFLCVSCSFSSSKRRYQYLHIPGSTHNFMQPMFCINKHGTMQLNILSTMPLIGFSFRHQTNDIMSYIPSHVW